MIRTERRMRPHTGSCALVTINLWLCILPLHAFASLGSLHDGATLAQQFHRIGKVVFPCILLGLGIYVAMLVFAMRLRKLSRRERELPDECRAGGFDTYLQGRRLGRRRHGHLSPIAVVPDGWHPLDSAKACHRPRACRQPRQRARLGG